MLVSCALALLCLLPVGFSAPASCEDLLRPVDRVDPVRLEGRWALVAGSVSDPELHKTFSKRDSATLDFSRTNDTSTMGLYRSLNMDAQCRNSSQTIVLEGSSFRYTVLDRSNIVGTFVHTSCQDCVLIRFNVDSGKRTHFYFFSRRREVDGEEMDQFRAQVDCLKMPPPAVMDPSKELCPEDSVKEEETQ